MKEIKHICKYCGKEFETAVKLGGHVSRCKENPKYNDTINKIQKTRQLNLNETNPLEEHICQCEICGKDYKINLRHNSYINGQYTKTCSRSCASKLTALHSNLEEKNKKISNKNKGQIPWSKGKKNINNKWTKNPNYKPYKICPICGKEYYNKKLKYCCDECKKIGKYQKLSLLAKKSNFGGYNPNTIKKHHHGNYKGIHCDSSWELAYLVYCLEHNIKIERCNEIRYYTINNKTKRYFPDFIVENKLVEIKGYFSKEAKIKAEQNSDIKVLLYDDLKESLEYTINKYGKKFWEVLYDK